VVPVDHLLDESEVFPELRRLLPRIRDLSIRSFWITKISTLGTRLPRSSRSLGR